MEFYAVDEFVSKLKKPYFLRYSPLKPNVIAILDEFSVQSFAQSANLWLVNVERPHLDLEFIKPDFLLVESAWSGNNGRWRYLVTSSQGPKEPLRKLVKACQEKGIPTVFWNKEDPPHFEDFISTANLFDYVFTSDSKMIPEYEKSLGRECADLMRFAAEPKIHNPQRIDGYREGNFAFAGQYFSHKFPERRQQMETLFPAADIFGLDIYSRALGTDPRYQFPAPFDQNVVGSLPYNEMVKTYRKYKGFINVNSVVNSDTMCARRVFELSACKTAVVGMESRAIRSIYGADEIPLANDKFEAAEICKSIACDDQLRNRITHRAWRKTLSHHTYEHRMRQIMEKIGIGWECSPICISVATKDGSFPEGLREMIHSQVFTLSRPVELQFVNERQAEDSFSKPKLGSVAPSFQLIVSPEYEYGPYFVNDLLLSALQSGAEVVTKAPSWLNLKTESFVGNVDMPWGFLKKLDSAIQNRPSVYVSDSFDLGRKGNSEVVSV